MEYSAACSASEGAPLRNVTTGQTSELPVTGPFIAIGHDPRTEPFKGQLTLDDEAPYPALASAIRGEGARGQLDAPTPFHMEGHMRSGSRKYWTI